MIARHSIPIRELAPADVTLETAARLLDAIEAQRPLRKGEAGEILRAARMWPAMTDEERKRTGEDTFVSLGGVAAAIVAKAARKMGEK